MNGRQAGVRSAGFELCGKADLLEVTRWVLPLKALLVIFDALETRLDVVAIQGLQIAHSVVVAPNRAVSS